jgi:hypothetical protein
MAVSQFKKTAFNYFLFLKPSPYRHLLADFIQIKLLCAEWQACQFHGNRLKSEVAI